MMGASQNEDERELGGKEKPGNSDPPPPPFRGAKGSEDRKADMAEEKERESTTLGPGHEVATRRHRPTTSSTAHARPH
jgi:hypothetical protein